MAYNNNRTYLAIDLKSYYASAECAARNLDPLTTNLVVADSSRTEKTICLAVSPALKSYGIPGRARLFEVVQKIKEVNAARLSTAIEIIKLYIRTANRLFLRHPMTQTHWLPTRPWRSLIWSRRHGCSTTRKSPGRSMASISNTSLRRISWYIRLTKYLLTQQPISVTIKCPLMTWQKP